MQAPPGASPRVEGVAQESGVGGSRGEGRALKRRAPGVALLSRAGDAGVRGA